MVQVSTEAGWLLSQLGNRYSESLVAEAQSRGEGAATINRLQADLQNMRRIVSLAEQQHTISDSDMGWLRRTLSHAFGEHHLLGTDTYTAQPLEEVLRCHGRENLLNLMTRWDSLALHGSVHQTTEEMRRRLGASHWSHSARNIVHDFVERMNTWEGVSQTALSIGTGIGAGVIVGTFLPAAGLVAFVGRSLITSIVQTSLTNGVENCRRVLSDREVISQSEWVQGLKTNVWENLLGDLAGARVAHEILEELVNMAVSTAGADVAHALGILEEEYQNVGSYWERLGENGLNTLMMKGMRRVSEGGVRLARFVGEVNPVNVAKGVGLGMAAGASLMMPFAGSIGTGMGVMFGMIGDGSGDQQPRKRSQAEQEAYDQALQQKRVLESPGSTVDEISSEFFKLAGLITDVPFEGRTHRLAREDHAEFIDCITAHLGHEDLFIQDAAAACTLMLMRSLSGVDMFHVGERLASFTGDGKEKVRERTMTLLVSGVIPHLSLDQQSHFTETIIARLGDPSSEVRSEALYGLASIVKDQLSAHGSSDVMRRMISLLDDDNPLVRRSASSILCRIEAVHYYITATDITRLQEVVLSRLRLLHDDDDDLVSGDMLQLSNSASQWAEVDRLRFAVRISECLDDYTPTQRITMISVLGGIIPHLQSSDDRIRLVNIVLRQLSTRDDRVRMSVVDLVDEMMDHLPAEYLAEGHPVSHRVEYLQSVATELNNENQINHEAASRTLKRNVAHMSEAEALSLLPSVAAQLRSATLPGRKVEILGVLESVFSRFDSETVITSQINVIATCLANPDANIQWKAREVLRNLAGRFPEGNMTRARLERLASQVLRDQE